jgi:hypothetical protein
MSSFSNAGWWSTMKGFFGDGRCARCVAISPNNRPGKARSAKDRAAVSGAPLGHDLLSNALSGGSVLLHPRLPSPRPSGTPEAPQRGKKKTADSGSPQRGKKKAVDSGNPGQKEEDSRFLSPERAARW